MNQSFCRQLNALIVLLVYISSSYCLHSISKRYQIPVTDSKNILQSDGRLVRDSILDRFQINANTIIRTHDSRALGAKYLNETELASNEDCLYWCWQTSPCNLAVYDQKTRGSCYLFDCGSNEDFRCKFTAHSFYSSSILQVNRHPYDLSQWGSQVQHEKELTKLRTNGPFMTASPASRSSTPSVRNLVAPSMVPTTTATLSFRKTSHCLHYQFECKNNSECIAIYNVCDGIPQCSDSSDEAIDLECHKSRFNSPNIKSDHESTSNLNLGQTVNSKKFEAKSPQSSEKLGLPYPRITEIKNPQVIPVYNYPKTANSEGVRLPDDQSIAAKKPTFAASDDSSAKISYPQYRGSWNQYYQQNDGINSGDNRGNGAGYAMEPEYLNGYNNRENSNSGSYWPTIGRQPNYDLSEQMISPSGQGYNGMSNKPVTGTDRDEWTQNNANNNYDSNYYDRISRVRPNKVETVANTAPNELSSDSKSFLNPKHEIKMESGFKTKPSSLGHSKYEKQLKSQSKGRDDSNKTKFYSKSNISYSHISSNKGFANSPGIVAVSYMHDSSQQNGRETNSAVIALSLGLCVTALLIVLVGCRMKSFKRKIARRGRPLAHDADYLVNGMYL